MSGGGWVRGLPEASGPNMLLMEEIGPLVVFLRSLSGGAEPPRNFQPLQSASTAATAAMTSQRVLRDSFIVMYTPVGPVYSEVQKVAWRPLNRGSNPEI